ncbi:hypothetical protein FBEOM_3907 [Fusarium beomiforme]|uniref:Ankyrin n=1 Tax=Fusarium beomiforme TaxID=44412 RepID=A0A9P5AP44_9HYPO|nr:hypothetical protein FBEOM_3907 [Fusarium beomiforme]
MNASSELKTKICTSCSIIASGAAACISAAKQLAEDSHAEQLKMLLSGLAQVEHEVIHLRRELDSKLIGSKLGEVLGVLLDGYVITIEVLRMQLDSLYPKQLEESDLEFLTAHWSCTTLYGDLCAFVIVLLEQKPDQQDVSLTLPDTKEIISQAEASLRWASNARVNKDKESSPRSQSSEQASVPNATTSDAPPAYSTASEPSPAPSSLVKHTPAPKRSSFFRKLFHKPDPLVATLCQAAIQGNEQQVSGLISQNANINGLGPDGDTPLKCAIRYDQVGTTRLLLQAGAQTTKLPPLFQAAKKGSLNVARMLIESGESVLAKSRTGQLYFVDVVLKGNLDGIRFLLENGAPANAKIINGSGIGIYIIVHAVKQNNIELARLLLDHGADINAQDRAQSNLMPSVLYMAITNNNPEMVGLLVDRGAVAQPANMLGTTILEATIRLKRFELVKKLIDAGANVSGTDMYQQPILIKVIRDPLLSNDEKIEVLRMLMDKGASPEAVDITFGLPAICHAVEMPSTPVVQELLSRGVNTKVRMLSGQTLLTYCIDVNRQNTVVALLAAGADVNEVDGLNRTPLSLALLRLDYNLAKKLMDYNADPTAAENEQAVKFIKAIGRKDFLKLLDSGLREEEAGPFGASVFRDTGSEAPPPSYEHAAGKA